MTINIAIAVSEGLVMAADSMTQINNGPMIIKNYPTAEKITELGKLPMAVMCSGLGAISQRSIMSYIREFEFDRLLGKTAVQSIHNEEPKGETPTVSDVAEELRKFMQTSYNGAEWPEPQPSPPGGANTPVRPQLTIVVGGYSPRSFFPEVYEIEFPDASIKQRHPNPNDPKKQPTISWWGVGTSLNRLLHGFDLNELMMAHNFLMQNPQAAQTVTGGAAEGLASIPPPNACLGPLMQLARMQVVLDFMPLQEAVEFADYLGHVAIGYSRFSAGNQVVGGELDVLAIQPEGLSWYRRKAFVASMASARRKVF
jgi:hypothetical protein